MVTVAAALMQDLVVGNQPSVDERSYSVPRQSDALVVVGDDCLKPERQTTLIRPHVIRPIPLKIHNPIPQHAVEEFYERAAQEGISGRHVHQAVMASHDWHRKWTQQDEQGHTMPEEDNASRLSSENDDEIAVILPPVPTHYAYDLLDRQAGAKNPSPGDKDSSEEEDFEDRKRVRSWNGFVRSVSPQSLQNPRFEPNTSNEDGISPVTDENEGEDEDYEPDVKRLHATPSGLIRPVALRVSRPVPPSPARDQLLLTCVIPRDITPSILSVGARSLSPLTLPSLCNSSGSSISTSSSSLNSSFANRNGAIHIIENDDIFRVPLEIAHPNRKCGGVPRQIPHRVNLVLQRAREGILHELAISGGETTSVRFQKCLDVLGDHFKSLGIDTCQPDCTLSDGTWLTLTKPTFFGSLGENDAGDPMYTLGRMAFDMFAPTSMVCSLQGNFNCVERVRDDDRMAMDASRMPTSLREDILAGDSVLRTYNIVAPFTIEPPLAAYPNAPNKDIRKPIRGIMTVYGYTLADPHEENRQSVWITGGRIQPNDDPSDEREWKRIFELHPPKHGFGEKAKLLAVKLLMGATLPEAMDKDGSLSYTFTRPLGGHNVAYVDTIYADETFRIIRGHRGTVFVFCRQGSKAPSRV